MFHGRFQHLMFSVGSRHPAIHFIKQFLNKYSRVGIFNLTPTPEFDLQTQSALAKYQTYKRLASTGVMDVKTWASIGVDMNSIEIQMAGMSDPLVNKLLNKFFGGGRGLSADEIKLAQTVYKSSIDYNKVIVHKGKYFDLPFGLSQPDNTLMTPNGEIYAPPNVYSSDYASYVSQDMKAIFIHEMCHVWQWQRNIKNIKTEGLYGQISNLGDYEEMYKYKLQKYIWAGTTENDLAEYGLEQQAAIIEDYYRVVLNNLALSSNRKGQNCQNTQPLNDIKDLLKFILKKFIANPSYLGSS